MPESIDCDWIVSDDEGVSHFETRQYSLTERSGMLLTEQLHLGANMRMRASAPGYRSEWHVSGEPVLILIQQGILRIHVSNECREYGPGQYFVAADQMPEGHSPQPCRHGHSAEVVGHEVLLACHIKLEADHG